MSDSNDANPQEDDIKELINFAVEFGRSYVERKEKETITNFLKAAGLAGDFVDAYKALYKKDPVTAIAGIVIAVGVVALVGTELGAERDEFRLRRIPRFRSSWHIRLA
jgi:hypothetical protein